MSNPSLWMVIELHPVEQTVYGGYGPFNSREEADSWAKSYFSPSDYYSVKELQPPVGGNIPVTLEHS